MHKRRLFLVVCLASLAYSQPAQEANVDRVLTLSYTETVQELQEAATLIRATGDIRQVTTETAGKAVILRGTAEQVRLAEWLAERLNQPANGSRFGLATPAAGKHELQLGTDDVVRVFYIDQARTIQELQEIATLTRATIEIRRLFTFHMLRAVAMRGTAEQMRMAEWLLDRVAAPSGVQQNAGREFQLPGDDVTRVFFFPGANSVQELQEAATALRAVGEIRRLFTYNGARAIAVRGTAEQIRLADWFLNELQNPSKAPAKPQFQMAGADDLVRMFYVANAPRVQDLQEIAVTVRATANIRRLFTYNAARVMVVRGSAAQLQLAEWLVEKLNQPAGSSVDQIRAVKHEYLPGAADDVVRVFFLANAAEPSRIQEIAVAVRTTTSVRQLMTYNALHAMTLRGTGEQMVSAERLLLELDKPRPQ